MFSVYDKVAELLNSNPVLAYTIKNEDLVDVVRLSEEHMGKLLQKDPLFKVKDIMNQKKIQQKVSKLNGKHRLALSMSDSSLHEVLEWAEDVYYNGKSEDPNVVPMKDETYDYVKRIYGGRVSKTNDKEITMKNVSSSTGTGTEKQPSRERDTRLPYCLKSLDNLFHGEGDVLKWSGERPGPYVVSCKMDGTSALWHNGTLYTRGNAVVGRNITHVAKLIGIPEVPDVNVAVRGEIVMKKKVFNGKYKGKKNEKGGVRKINRNSVAGGIQSVNNIDKEFIRDLDFVAYEVIVSADGQQMKPSKQFAFLRDHGFKVAHNFSVEHGHLNDAVLSSEFRKLMESYDYVIDGLVISQDVAYKRSNSSSKNPSYAKAYKEPLENDTAITKVIKVEWNPSQYGYMCPTVVYEPVDIHGITLQRATAHTARDVLKQGLGPGAVIEVVYWSMVNPRINRVLEPVQAQMPNCEYEWTKNDNDELVHIKVTGGAHFDVVEIKKIHKFLIEIGAKGIGETTVKKIYERDPNMRSVGAFINVAIENVAFLGPQLSKNIVDNIRASMQGLNYATLMSSSKVFGRGLGAKKFEVILAQFPEIMDNRLPANVYVEMLKTVDGIGPKTAKLFAKNINDFWDFLDENFDSVLLEKIITNTRETKELKQNVVGNKFAGQVACLTGFRDPGLVEYIVSNGGKVTETFNKKITMLVVNSLTYVNKKVTLARELGISIMTPEMIRN